MAKKADSMHKMPGGTMMSKAEMGKMMKGGGGKKAPPFAKKGATKKASKKGY